MGPCVRTDDGILLKRNRQKKAGVAAGFDVLSSRRAG
jgi:hypothetical protein